MHSSRMRVARSLSVFPGSLPSQEGDLPKYVFCGHLPKYVFSGGLSKYVFSGGSAFIGGMPKYGFRGAVCLHM